MVELSNSMINTDSITVPSSTSITVSSIGMNVQNTFTNKPTYDTETININKEHSYTLLEIKEAARCNPYKWNAVPAGFDINACSSGDPMIVNIDILVPNKVVEVTIYISNNWYMYKKIHTYKQVCKDGDEFDLKYALALAWAKYINKTHCLDWSIGGGSN